MQRLGAHVGYVKATLPDVGLAEPRGVAEDCSMRSFLAAGAVILATMSASLAAPAVDTAKAEAVIKRCVSIYHEPIDGKSHPCACPLDHMKNGYLCGRVSAHDRPGGAEPVCFVTEVTPELLKDFRTNEQTDLRGRCQYGR